MPFNPPDPDKIIQTLERLRDAHHVAAEAKTGSAQPLFQRLADLVDTAVDKVIEIQNSGEQPDMMDMMNLVGSMTFNSKSILGKLQREMEHNPAAAETFQQLQQTMQEEMQTLMESIMPDIGGMIPPGGFNLPKPGNKQTPPPVKNKPLPPPKKPAKPNDGDFDL